MVIKELKPITRQRAFTLLMQGAFGGKSIPGMTAVYVKKHPFDLDVPKNHGLTALAIFVGNPGGTSCSVDGIIRLVGQQLGEWNSPVYHLRTIYYGNNSGHDVYYEIGIGTHFFICGGCTDCSGTGGSGKETMDGVMECLSETYGVPVQTLFIRSDFTDGQRVVREFLDSPAVEKEDASTPAMGDHTFHKGQQVRFSEFAHENPPSHFCGADEVASGRTYTIDEVEPILDRCTCNLGATVARSLHPERCLLRVRPEQMHHQFLHFKVDDTVKRLSGVYFEPA